MKNEPIQLPVIIDQIRANKDRSLTIKLETPEMIADETAKLMDMMTRQVWCAFADVGINKEDLSLPSEIVEFKGEKSLSERLRNVLYVYWETKTAGDRPFEEFRRIQMEKIIQSIKDKLD